jgi:predicted CoA-substrate-specific enzyme activase
MTKTEQSQMTGEIVAGVDVGSVSTKCVLLKNHKMVASIVIPTDADPRRAGREAFEKVLDAAGTKASRVCCITGTGYGRVSNDMFDATVTELSCHARGARWLNPDIEGLIDIGGQDSKAIRLNPDGTILDFVMNDRCAAGTGRFLETMAKVLKINMDTAGEIGCHAAAPCSINSTCVVFAESEVISLLAAGETKADIAAGLIDSIAQRVGTMARRIGLSRNVAFVGGGAKNIGLRQSLEKFLEEDFISIPEDPQMTGALGAALIAHEKHGSICKKP